VYEVLGRASQLTSAQTQARTHYAEGLAAYRARRWQEAKEAFAAALKAVPGDGPSITMLTRIDAFSQNPPAGDWDGSWRLEQK
jgi:adenylate cyclase